ncbi:hypothetical protein D3C85_1912000 [compost metagenome]
MQVAAQDGADVRVTDDGGQCGLAAQLHHHCEVLHAWDGRVMEGKDGAVRGWRGQLRGQPLQLGF